MNTANRFLPKIAMLSALFFLLSAACGLSGSPSTPVAGTTDEPSPSTGGSAPVIQSVELRSDTSSGDQVIYQDIHFTDSDGDVNRWDFEIVSTTNPDVSVEGGELDIPGAEQKSGAVVTGEWGCGGGNYSITLRVTLTDRAGHQSAPYDYTMECIAASEETGQRYTEAAGGFSYIPPTGWEVVAYEGLAYKIVRGPATGNFTMNINFVDEAYNDSLDSYVDASISSIMQAVPGAMVTAMGELTTNKGLRCIKVTIQSTQSGFDLNQVLYFFDTGAKKFIATYTRLRDGGQENDALVDQSMKTFRIGE